jgi:hypothetical protein
MRYAMGVEIDPANPIFVMEKHRVNEVPTFGERSPDVQGDPSVT